MRPAAGRLQADAERQERHHLGGPGRDDRLHRHDPVGRYGGRDPAGKAILKALNTDLVCDAINVAIYGRSQTAFSLGGLPIGSGYEELGHSLRSIVGTIYGSVQTGPRYFEIAEGYVLKLGLDEENQIIGYQFVNLGKMLAKIRAGAEPNKAHEESVGVYGRFAEAAKVIDPRAE